MHVLTTPTSRGVLQASSLVSIESIEENAFIQGSFDVAETLEVWIGSIRCNTTVPCESTRPCPVSLPDRTL